MIERLAKELTGPKARKRFEDYLHTYFKNHNAVKTQSLSYALIQDMVDLPLRIAMARTSATGTGRQSYFSGYYNSGLWLGRIQRLFAWDDQAPNRRPRSWDNDTFRQLTQAILFRIDSILGSRCAQLFFKLLIQQVAQKLLFIPQYDYDKLSILYKQKASYPRHHRSHLGDDLPGKDELAGPAVPLQVR